MMFSPKILFPLLMAAGTVLASQAHASTGVDTDTVGSCENVDLTSELPPVRNQDEAEWCFAYVAADMISQRLQINISPTGIADSSFRAAISYSRDQLDLVEPTLDNSAGSKVVLKSYRDQVARAVEDGKIPMQKRNDGGTINLAMRSLSEYGLCYESDVPSEMGLDSVTGRAARARASRISVVHHQSADGALNDAWHAEINDRCHMYLSAEPFRTISTDGYGEIVKGEMKNSEEARQGILDAVNEALDRHRIAAIRYDSNILDGSQAKETAAGGHENSVVARVCDSSCNCKYRVRNSWGKGACSSYVKPYNIDCKDGMFWLQADELKKRVSDTNYLE